MSSMILFMQSLSTLLPVCLLGLAALFVAIEIGKSQWKSVSESLNNSTETLKPKADSEKKSGGKETNVDFADQKAV